MGPNQTPNQTPPQRNPEQAAAEKAVNTQDPTTAEQLLKSKATLSGIDPDTLQMLMSMVGEMGRTIATELRKPTEEEQRKIDAENKRIQQQRIQAAASGKAVEDAIRREQESCGHIKPNGEHTWGGQVHSDGWAQITCQRCVKRYRVRPLPEMIAQGLNLSNVPGLTEAHLIQWSKQSAAIDAKLAEVARAQAAMSGMRFNPNAGEAITGL
jgi:hypothetical protein